MAENLVPLGSKTTSAQILIRRNPLDPDGSCDVIIYFNRDSERKSDTNPGDDAKQTVIFNGDLHAHTPYFGADTAKDNPTSFILKVTVDSKKPGTGGDRFFNELKSLF